MPAETACAAPIVTERFEIRDLIGRGGMGEVYRAWDNELEMDVALKALRPAAASDPALLARFRREAKLARRIKHVNVAQVHDIVESGGRRFLSMEFVEGRTLAAILKARGALPLHVACSIIGQACHGVQAAHELGIIHRDLKPQNIMVRRRGGRTCILDFGIARETGDSDLTEAGLIVGSPQYMSSEQLSGGPVTTRSDVYTLGLVLYELLTGVSPFRVPGASTATLRALRTVPPDPRRHDPRLPGFVAEAVMHALAPKPEERFATAMDLAAALVPVREEAVATVAGDPDESDLAIPVSPRVLLGLPAGALRDELASRLSRMGLDVTPSSDGRAALDASYGGNFALAILGASLTNVDGLTACQLMRRNPRCDRTRFVLVLDAPDPGREAFARQVGASDVLHLPLNVHAFTRKVRELLVE